MGDADERMQKLFKYVIVTLVCLIFILMLVLAIRWQDSSRSGEREISSHYLVVEKIEDLGRLELVRYKLRDVVEQKIERSWWKGGDTKLLVIVGGEAVGCIDLSRVKLEDVVSQGDSLKIMLPQPELCHVKINHNETKLYDSPTSPFTNNAPVLEAAYRQAEEKMRISALEMGILEQTRQNAHKILGPLLSSVAEGRHVSFDFKEAGEKESEVTEKGKALRDWLQGRDTEQREP